MTTTPVLSRTGTKVLEPKIFTSPSTILNKYPSRLLRSSSIFSPPKRYHDIELVSTDEILDKSLTKDILFFIFTMLSRKDLARASLVCKRWRIITQDAFFGWVPVVTMEVYGKSQFAIPEEFDVMLKPAHPYGWEDPHIVDFYTRAVVGACYVKYIRLFGLSADVQIKQSLAFEHRKLWRRSTELVGDRTYKLTLEVNVKEFETLVSRDGTNVPGGDIVKQYIQAENAKVTQKRIESVIGNKGSNIPTKSFIPQKQPEGLRDGLNLYKYQLDAVAWMKSLEDDIDNEYAFKYSSLVPWRSAKSSVLFDTKANKFVTFADLPNCISSFCPKGGVLADEMGLGKTIEFLGLFLANPGPKEVEEEPINLDEIVIEKRKNQDDEKEQAEFEKLQYYSRATLVLCPNHLVQQWESEIVKNSNPPLKVYTLTTLKELTDRSYQDIVNADIVIASFQLLKNLGYFRIGTTPAKSIKYGEQTDRYSWVRNHLKRIRKGVAKTPPILEHFRWFRMVIDEGHEIIVDPFYKDTLALYAADHYWYVTGTPFPSRGILEGIMTYLEFPDFLGEKMWPLTDLLVTNLYWRNTRASVKDEYKIPPIVEELIVLEFTDVEKVLFADSGQDRKLCSQLPAKSLDEIREIKIIQHMRSADSYKRSIKASRQKARAAQAKLDDPKLSLSQWEKDREKEEIERANKDMKYYSSLLERHLEYRKKFKKTMIHAERYLTVCKSLNLPFPAKIVEMLKESSQQFRLEEHKDIEEKEKYKEAHPEHYPSEDDEQYEEFKEDNNYFDAFGIHVEEGIKKTKEEPKEQQKEETPKEEEEEEEGSDEEEKLTAHDLQKMTVAQLRAELTRRGVKFLPKTVKADLINLLKESLGIKDDKPSEPEKKPTVSRSGRKVVTKEPEPEKKSVDEKKAEGVASLTEKDIQKMTVAQLKAELTKRGAKTEPKALKADLQAQLKKICQPTNLVGEVEPQKTVQSTKRKGKEEKTKIEEPTSKKPKAQDSNDNSKVEDKMDVEEQKKESAKQLSQGELADELLGLMQRLGTKMANLIYYLKRLWEQKPETRFNSVLWEVSDILAQNEIETSFVQGNVMSRNKAIKDFRSKDSEVKVIMLGTEKAASGTNLVEASHVILMDAVTGTKEEAQAIEGQAIARAHRQGQTHQVTLVRFIIKDTMEHTSYVKNYLDDDDSQFQGKQKDLGAIHKVISQVNNMQFADINKHRLVESTKMKRTPSGIRHRMLKAGSIGNLLANSPLKSSQDIIQLIEGSNDVDVPETPEPVQNDDQ